MIDGLKNADRAAILDTLRANHKVERVVLFGSRAMETYTVSSDVDIALFGKKLSLVDQAKLSDTLDRLPIPQRVDLLLHDRVTNQDLIRHVREHGIEWFNRGSDAQDDWQELELGECVVINDSTYSPKENWPLVNYLDTGNITENRVDSIQEIDVVNQKLPTRARRKVKPGDVVYSTVRPNQRHYGIINDPPPNFLASTGFAVLRGIEEIADTEFIYWYLAQDHIVEYLHAIAENSTSAYPSIKPSDLELLTLNLPTLPEQRRIAHILGTLDDKIELNRRMNETLEEMARAVFKDWFVDFGPVRAKMEGREAYLPEDVWGLFPDRLVESELGLVPEGWGIVPLPEIVDFREGPGIRHWQYTNSDEGTRFINIRCIQDGDLILDTANRVHDEEANGKYSHFHLEEWDIVLSASGTLGRSAVVRQEHLPLLLNTSVIRFRPVKGATSFAYLRGYLGSEIFLDEQRTLASGSVQKNFGPTHLKQMKAWLPPYECVGAYETIAGPLLRRVSENMARSDALRELRDTLLPVLISGEVGV